MEDLLGWFLVFIFLISLLGILSYQVQLMCLTDLEGDYINQHDSAARINVLVFPEFVTQGILCILFLITGHWFMFLLSLPYLYYNVKMYRRRQHLVDATEIFNQLTWEKKLRLYKLVYLIVLLVLCIFWYYACGCFDTLHESLFGLYEVTTISVIGYFGPLEKIIINDASVLPKLEILTAGKQNLGILQI